MTFFKRRCPRRCSADSFSCAAWTSASARLRSVMSTTAARHACPSSVAAASMCAQSGSFASFRSASSQVSLAWLSNTLFRKALKAGRESAETNSPKRRFTSLERSTPSRRAPVRFTWRIARRGRG